MLFSKAAVHGIYALCYLNEARVGRFLSATAIASALGIPRDQAAKVLQRLNNAALVESTRGRHGGYELTRRLDEISVVEVLDALNPPPDDALLRPQTCQRDSDHLCSAHRGLLRLNDRARQALLGETLAELKGTVCHDSDPSRRPPRAEFVCIEQGDHCP